MHRGLLSMAIVLSPSLLSISTLHAADPARVTPLVHAHAHNDYAHARPLLDALDQGFTSVEADIFLVDGQLLVGHSSDELKPDRTLQKLYLDPLLKCVQAGQGRVYAGGPPLTLFIDIKSSADETYRALARVLAEYAEMLSVVRDGKREQKAIDVVISGNRPRSLLAEEKVRYAGLDGRLSDLDSEVPAAMMPIISDNWRLNFKWTGEGPIGEADRKKLADAVAKTHAHGRRLRLWATPENTALWRELRSHDVDLINTDDLAGLAAFLRTESKN